jgi:hypothetical protein
MGLQRTKKVAFVGSIFLEDIANEVDQLNIQGGQGLR